jgi:Fe-S cluster biogenesis protein NfuA
MLPKLAAPIRSAPSATGQVSEGALPREMPKWDSSDEFLQKAKKVLDDTIMPALSADGGGLEIIGRHEKQIMIRYMGACSTCPAGMTGTLVAIEGILKSQVDPEIVVITV